MITLSTPAPRFASEKWTPENRVGDLARAKVPDMAGYLIKPVKRQALNDDILKCLETGRDEYLSKPIRKTVLIETICRLTAGASSSGD